MRLSIFKMAVALAVTCGYSAFVSCGDDSNGSPDGGGGSGGTGGSGGATDAGGDTGFVGCLNPDATPTTCPTPAVTFANVQGIFQAKCVSVCHNGVTPDPTRPGETLWPLIERQHILDWHDTVRATMAECLMPPPDSGVPLTIEERRAIIEFIRCEGPK